jgi:hypothetical protein
MQVRTTREHNSKTREEANTEASLPNTPLGDWKETDRNLPLNDV